MGDLGVVLNAYPRPDCSNLSLKIVLAAVLSSRGAAEGDVAVAAAVGSPTKRHAQCGNDRGMLG